MPRQRVDQWLQQHLATQTFKGLIWKDQEKQIFFVRWEKKGNSGYDLTFDICEKYHFHSCQKRKSDLRDSEIKSRFHDALKKSPYIGLLEKEKEKQENNYMLCKFIDVQEKDRNPAPQQELSTVSLTEAEQMETNEPAAFNVDDFIAGLPRDKLNVYRISLHYDGNQVCCQDCDLSTPQRFHSGDCNAQIKEAKDTSCGEQNDSRIDDLMVHSVCFPPYQGNNGKTAEYLRESDYGVILSSQNGILKAKRICRNKIYHSLMYSGKFEKLLRREEKVIFSLEECLKELAQRRYDVNREVCLAYGKNPKPSDNKHICLVIKPHIQCDMGSMGSVEASSSKSLEDSLDRQVRFGQTFEMLKPLIDKATA